MTTTQSTNYITMQTNLSNAKTIHLTTIQFPEVQLQTRDAHKLRGYFGTIFKEHSPLLHNHYENGGFRHRYPMVQYKVIRKVPTLVAIDEGAELLTSLFLKISEITINDKTYSIHSKNIKSTKEKLGFAEGLNEFTFETLWMALNQENYKKFKSLNNSEKNEMLNKILNGHVLSFFKQMGIFLEKNQRLISRVFVQSKSTKFKNQAMMAFSGGFVINADLPDHIGLGKAVSRGFGTIRSGPSTTINY